MTKLTAALLSLLLLAALAFPQQGMGPGPGLGKPPGSGPADFVTETFTEASDANITDHTGELGATWTKHPDAGYGTTATIDATNDRLFTVNVTTAFFTSGVPPSADYCCECVMRVVSITATNAAIAWRMDTSANTMMIFQINNGTGWRMRKIVTGTQTTIGSEDTTTSIPGVGDARTMRACSSGNTHTAFIDGALLGTVGGSDSSVTGAGRGGLRFSGAASASTGYHIESFRCFTP
jgi:hypothetical protein